MTKKPDTATALAGILRARRGDDQVDDVLPSPALPPAVAATSEETEVAPPPPASPRAKSRTVAKTAERTTGKRNDPDYVQALAYVPKKLRKAVDKALLDIDGLDYSTLTEDLLRKWLKTRGIAE